MICTYLNNRQSLPDVTNEHDSDGSKQWDLIDILTVDEPAHQILLYTLLFLLFHYFLYITDPPLCTPANTTTHVCTHSCTTLAFISLDQPHLFDGQMFYDSHALFPFLVAQCAPSYSLTNHKSLCHIDMPRIQLKLMEQVI